LATPALRRKYFIDLEVFCQSCIILIPQLLFQY